MSFTYQISRLIYIHKSRPCVKVHQSMLRALQTGTWSGFHHSIKDIHLDQLPRCPVCLRMKNKHKPVSNVGRMVPPRSGLLFHMNIKTVRTRSIHHQHYVVDIIDDNSGMANPTPYKFFTAPFVDLVVLISSHYAWITLAS